MRMLPAFLCVLTAGAVMAEDAVTYEPGCTAKIYVIGRHNEHEKKENDKLWPIKALPDAPSETIRLPGGPNIETDPSDKTNNGYPNYLVRSKLGLLKDVNYYAVEFEGWVQAKADGVYTISTQSDDPVEIFMEGKPVLRSDFFANWESRSLNELETAQGSVKLSVNKWYHVAVISRQRWCRSDGNGSWNTNRGAHLKVWMATPGGQASIIPLCLPSKVAGQQ